MARNAFLDGLAAYDVAFKREEQAGRNFFADAMDANKTNNTLMNDAVTRAFNQQTIDQRGQQFPYALAGLSRTDELARTLHPAMKALTGVQADTLSAYANDPQGYAKLLTDGFGFNNANKQIDLLNAQAGVKQAAFSKDYLAGNLDGIASHIGVDPSTLWRAPSGLIVHTDTAGKQTVVQPTMFNIAMNQQKVKSDQVMASIAAAQSALHPTGTAGYGGAAAPSMVVGTRRFPSPDNAAPAVGMTASIAEPNTPDIKDAAGMTPMVSQSNADMLTRFNRGTVQPTEMVTSAATPSTPSDTAQTSTTVGGPNLAGMDAEIAWLTANGLNPVEAIARRSAAVSEFEAAQQAKASAARKHRKILDTRALRAMGLQSSGIGHVKLDGPTMIQLVDIAHRDPELVRSFGMTPATFEEMLKFNAATYPTLKPGAPPAEPRRQLWYDPSRGQGNR